MARKEEMANADGKLGGDPLSAALDEIGARNEQRIETLALTEWTVKNHAAEGDVRCLLAALRHMLKEHAAYVTTGEYQKLLAILTGKDEADAAGS